MRGGVVAGASDSSEAGTPEPRRGIVILQTAVCIGGLTSLFLYRMSGCVVDLDVWHAMALARESVRLGHVPLADCFAYVPTVYPSVQHELGFGLLMYGLTSAFGGVVLVVLRYLLVLALVGLCLTNARRRGATWPALMFLAPVFLLLIEHGFSPIRAQLFSFLFTAVLLYFFELDRQGKRWWLPVWLGVFVLWVNLHGGFVVGAGLFLFHWIEQLCRKQPHWHLFVTGLLLIPLVACTPYHFYYYSYLAHALTMPRPHVSEWGKLWEIAPPGQLAVYVLSLAVLFYAVYQTGWRRAVGLPLIIITALAALNAHRLLCFYAVVWFTYTPGYLARTAVGEAMGDNWNQRRAFHIVFWGVVCVYFLALLVPLQPWRARVPGFAVKGNNRHVLYPVGVVEYLRQHHFEGNLLVDFDRGAFVMWKLYPHVKVSMDSRYEVAYPPEVEEEQYRFQLAESGWQDLLKKRGYRSTDAMLIVRDLPIGKVIDELPGWKRVYDDDEFMLYVPQDSMLPYQDRRGEKIEGTYP